MILPLTARHSYGCDTNVHNGHASTVETPPYRWPRGYKPAGVAIFQLDAMQTHQSTVAVSDILAYQRRPRLN
jgi:hypothetical protein